MKQRRPGWVLDPKLVWFLARTAVTSDTPNPSESLAVSLRQRSQGKGGPSTTVDTESGPARVGNDARAPHNEVRRGPLDPGNPVMVFGFFCGCGGASAGFREVGMEIAFGLDNDPEAERTFEANFPEAEFIDDDIATVADSAIDAVVGAWPNHALLFNAGAPCQPFSRQRRGTPRPDDKRLGLLASVLRFVRRHRPEYVFVENVPGLQDAGAGAGILGDLLHTLRELGYSTDHRVVKSQDYGIPQKRTRLVLLASLLGPSTFPEPTHGRGMPNTEYSGGTCPTSPPLGIGSSLALPLLQGKPIPAFPTIGQHDSRPST